MLIASALFLKGVQDKNDLGLVFAGLFGGLAGLMRDTNLAIPLIFFAYLVSTKKRGVFRDKYVALSGLLLVLLLSPYYLMAGGAMALLGSLGNGSVFRRPQPSRNALSWSVGHANLLDNTHSILCKRDLLFSFNLWTLLSLQKEAKSK